MYAEYCCCNPVRQIVWLLTGTDVDSDKMAQLCQRLCCCLNCPRVHPLHHIINVGETQQQPVNMPDKLTFTSLQTLSRADIEDNISAVVVCPLHASAVNGDKSSLTKLLSSGWNEHVDTVDKHGRTALMYSALGDRPDCAELLLKAGADINLKDSLGRTALHWAAHKGNVSCVRLLLAQRANWKEKDNDGQTPLHLCTRHKSEKCLAMLLKVIQPGAVDDQDANKRTALHLAALSGNLEQMQLLIKQDSNVAIPDDEGRTPLHWAAGSKDPEAVKCVKLLLETTPNVINWQDYEGCTALHLAVADGNQAVVAELLKVETCNVNALDNMFHTPLHWAAVLGHSAIVETLLDGKADYASSDSNAATPLHYAAQKDFAETVEVFLSRPSIKDEPDNEGRTAFMWAAGSGANTVIRCFIKHGVDFLQMDKTGATAMHAAASAGHASTVRLLFEAGGLQLVEATDLAKCTPLSRACEMGRVPVVETLIECGAKVADVKDQDGQSLLHWAALGGHPNVCLTLLKYGIDPNICDLAGRTPLHCAAYHGSVSCMSVLLEHKANCALQDHEGKTSLHFACSRGHIDAIKLLLQCNAVINTMEFTEDRYTPLDYALMGEHFEVAQCMIEHGAVSITGIQDIAALKIQAWFRGYRVRKTFIERKKLLMKHEKLLKDAKKKADERSQRQIGASRLSPHSVGLSLSQPGSSSSLCETSHDSIESSVAGNSSTHSQATSPSVGGGLPRGFSAPDFATTTSEMRSSSFGLRSIEESSLTSMPSQSESLNTASQRNEVAIGDIQLVIDRTSDIALFSSERVGYAAESAVSPVHAVADRTSSALS